MNQQYMRQELWKYRRVFDTYEKEWIKMPFKKLDINHLSQKVHTGNFTYWCVKVIIVHGDRFQTG